MREPDENSREDGRDCQNQFYGRDNAYNKCTVPGSMYKKSPLYTPGNAGKSDMDEESSFWALIGPDCATVGVIIRGIGREFSLT